MPTPLFDALEAYKIKNAIRFHTPGHKGNLAYPLSELAPYDLTELSSTGSLFDETGPMLCTEKMISDFYGSGASLISAGGSTLCVQAMLGTFCPQHSKVIMGRGCHRSAISACALLSLEIAWVYPDVPSGGGLPGFVSACAIKAAIENNPTASAVFITSPDYFGSIGPIEELMSLCHEHNIPLLVDNSHGSHLKFFEGFHPLELGADCCCDSFHKTLPVMTGGAALHLKDIKNAKKARSIMALFGSSSPSYPIMLSIEFMASNLSKLKEEFLDFSLSVAEFKKYAISKNLWATCGLSDPMRITLDYSNSEINTDELLAILAKLNIEAEYYTQSHVVFLPSPKTELSKLYTLADIIATKTSPHEFIFSLPHLDQKLPLRDAMLGESILLPIELCDGRIAAQLFSPCPPGVPIVVPGEEISIMAKEFIKNYGALELFVLK